MIYSNDQLELKLTITSIDLDHHMERSSVDPRPPIMGGIHAEAVSRSQRW
jgi:hypothetical protein